MTACRMIRMRLPFEPGKIRQAYLIVNRERHADDCSLPNGWHSDGTPGAHGAGRITTMSHNDCNSASPVRNAPRSHLNSCIIVFSSMRKALYVNEAARRVLRRLDRSDNGRPTNGALPSSVN